MKFPTAATLLLAIAPQTAANEYSQYQKRAAALHSRNTLRSVLETPSYDSRTLQEESDGGIGALEEGDNMLQCDHQYVAQWVDDSVKGGRCSAFADLMGGVELCRKYEDYTDPTQCYALDNAPTFDISSSVGGSGPSQMGPSPMEECLFFVNHLLPSPYFLDLDSVLPVFGSGFDYPTEHDCVQSDDHQCEVMVRYEEDYPAEMLAELAAANITIPPAPAPFYESAPCTRCDFYYDSDDVCFPAPCEFFNCEEPLTPTDIPEINRTVEVCFQNTRTDLFGFTEHRLGPYYGCSVATQEKIWTTEFHVGVTNIQYLEFKIGEYPATGEEDMAGMDYCELTVDGVACNSCNFCSSNDTNPHIEMDCENIIEGGKTSCDEENDFIFGIAHKLISLQDGHSRPPTPSPTMEPGTQVSKNGGFEGGLDADSLEGMANSAATVVRVGVAVVLAALAWVL